MSLSLHAGPLDAAAFAPFGEVIDLTRKGFSLINDGKCRRFTDLASFDVVDGDLGLSLFDAEVRDVPHTCDLLERHPLGSQCFVPMGGSDYLVIVAPDAGGIPGDPVAFVARSDQAVNLHRNTWHGVLAPISGTGLFAVLDRIGEGANLEEFRLTEPVIVAPVKP